MTSTDRPADEPLRAARDHGAPTMGLHGSLGVPFRIARAGIVVAWSPYDGATYPTLPFARETGFRRVSRSRRLMS
jgi:hypothetical protein